MDPIDFLYSLERLGMKLGLENINTLCAALRDPQRSFRSIIIAGTNGKGSVTVMVETALRAAGHRTARFTSPHLVRLEERFVIDGAEVGTDALRNSAGKVQRAVESLIAEGKLEGAPTFFECATAIAFDLFRAAGVEVAVLEVGLGGRLDATNVVLPMAAAITTIDLDHQAQLGDSLESIAREKAGVIKPGIAVVCGELPDVARRIVAAACAEQGARMIEADSVVQLRSRAAARMTMVDVRTATRSLEAVPLALPGRHQVGNAAVAIALLDELTRQGLAVPDAALRSGLSDARWPARLEHFTRAGAEVLLDAAHNPAGARALAAYLTDIGWSSVTLVFGAMHDKDVGRMLEPLMPFCASIICTTAPSPRALTASAVAGIATGLRTAQTPEIIAIDDPPAALDTACRPGARVVSAGSIFLIGPLRDILR